MIVDVNSKVFQGLKNPYSGLEMKVKMVIPVNGRPLFFAPDTYSTRVKVSSAHEAYDLWNRVDGISGLKTNQPIVCAYTGEPLVPATDGASHWLEKGFDPTLFHSRDEFLYYAWMRNGVSPYPPPSEEIKVISVDEEAPMPTTHEAKYIEGSLEAAEDAMKKSNFVAEKKTVVHGYRGKHK